MTPSEKTVCVYTELMNILLKLKVVEWDTRGVKAYHRGWFLKRKGDELHRHTS